MSHNHEDDGISLPEPSPQAPEVSPIPKRTVLSAKATFTADFPEQKNKEEHPVSAANAFKQYLLQRPKYDEREQELIAQGQIELAPRQWGPVPPKPPTVKPKSIHVDLPDPKINGQAIVIRAADKIASHLPDLIIIDDPIPDEEGLIINVSHPKGSSVSVTTTVQRQLPHTRLFKAACRVAERVFKRCTHDDSEDFLGICPECKMEASLSSTTGLCKGCHILSMREWDGGMD